MLPIDLAKIIINYLPLPVVQLLGDSGYSNKLKSLLNFNKNSILPPFNRYCRLRMLNGQAGYSGQLYMPVYACLFNCIFDDRSDLLYYYKRRYFRQFDQNLIDAIGWPKDVEWNIVIALIFYLISRYITNLQSKQIFNSIFKDYLYRVNFCPLTLSIGDNNVEALTKINPNQIDLNLLNNYFPVIDISNFYSNLYNQIAINIDIVNNAKLMID